MTCERFRSLISDHLDGLLPEAAAREAEDHLAACSACRKELAEWEAARAALARLEPDEPPPELAAAVLGAIGSRGADFRTRVPGRSRAMGRAVAAAAAILLLGGSAALCWRAAALRRDLADAHRRIGELEARDSEGRRARLEVAGRLEAAEAERGRLAAELADSGRRIAEAAAAFRAAADREAATVATLRRELDEGAEQVARLESARAADSERLRRLEDLVAAAGAPRAETVPAAAGAPGRLDEPAPVSAALRANGGVRILFRRRDGASELELRGPRSALVPELIRMARDPVDPELAGVALSAAESIVGREEPAPPVREDPGDPAGLLGLWKETRARLAGGPGPAEADGAARERTAGTLEDRIRRVEGRWLRAAEADRLDLVSPRR